MPGRYQQAHSRGYFSLLSTAFNTGACNQDSIIVGSELNDGIKQSMVVCDFSTLKHASLASHGHSDNSVQKLMALKGPHSSYCIIVCIACSTKRCNISSRESCPSVLIALHGEQCNMC